MEGIKDSDKKRSLKNYWPLLLLPFLLLLVVLGTNYFLASCLIDSNNKINELSMIKETEANVLAVTSFTTNTSSSEVADNSIATFTVSATTDAGGSLNGTLTMAISGEGEFVEAPTSEEIVCVLLSDTNAVCNNILLLPNETFTWTARVAASDTCSESGEDLALSSSLVGLVGIETLNTVGTVDCVSDTATTPPANPPATPPTTPPSANPSAPPANGGNGNGEITEEDVDTNTRNALNEYRDFIAQCQNGKATAIAVWTFVITLLLVLAYLLLVYLSQRVRTAKVEEQTTAPGSPPVQTQAS